MNQSFAIINPGGIHHIDPRIKLLHTLAAGVLLFVVRSETGVLLNVGFMAAVLVFLGLRGCAAKLAAYTAVLYGLTKLLAFIGGGMAAFIGVTVYIFFKFAPVAGIYFMMTGSIGASELVNALEKIGLPRSVTITFAVTLRFMPTIGQEIGAIRDSMKIRGIPLNLWNVVKAPLMMMEYVMVPLMMRFVKVAEELAAAAVVRGIERPGRRGSLFVSRLRPQDGVYVLAVAAYAVFLCCFEKGMIL